MAKWNPITGEITMSRPPFKSAVGRYIRNLMDLQGILALRQKPSKYVPGVYFLFLGNELMYIGQSKHIPARIEAHRDNPFFQWDTYSFIQLSGFTKEELELVEHAYIMAYKPKINPVANAAKKKRINKLKRMPK